MKRHLTYSGFQSFKIFSHTKNFLSKEMTYSKLIYSPAVLLHLYLLCFPQNNKHLYIMAPVNLHFHKESKLNFSVLHSASICHPNDNILLHACNMVPKIRNYFRCVFTGGGGEGQSCNLHFPLSS